MRAVMIGQKSEFEQGHIPGLQFLDYTTIARDALALDARRDGAGRARPPARRRLSGVAARRPSGTKEVASPAPGKLTPRPQSNVLAELDSVRANLRPGGVDLVDARTANVYSGETRGRNRWPVHIPGAVSVPYSSLVDERTRLLPVEQLQNRFDTADVKKEERLVRHCHIGQQTTVVYFVARYLGFDTRRYDGSFEERIRHAELLGREATGRAVAHR